MYNSASFNWTDVAIEQVRIMRSEGHSSSEIGRKLGVSKNAVVGKARRAGLPRKYSVFKSNGLGSIAGWPTPERIEILRKHWPTYRLRYEIIEMLAQVEGPDLPALKTITSYANSTLRLNRPSDFQKVTGQRPRAYLRPAMAPRAPVISLPVAKPAPLLVAKPAAVKAPAPVLNRPVVKHGGGPSAQRTVTIGAINWAAVAAVKIERVPGQCRWPLTCVEPSAGRFCAEHSGLLGRRTAA